MSDQKYVTESRQVEGYNQVILRSIGQVIIQQGEKEGLTVEAEKDLMPNIVTVVENEALILDVGRGWYDRLLFGLKLSPVKHLRYIVHVKQLRAITLAGAGTIEVGELAADRLAIEITGQGQVTIASLAAVGLTATMSGQGTVQLAGQAGDQTIRLNGMGTYDGLELEGKTGQATITGNGTIKLAVEDTLQISITGMGTVEYRGSPKVTQRITGLGAVRQVSAD